MDFTAIPQSASQWWTCVVLALGLWAGWVTHPVVWVVAGPLRILRLFLASASQESGYSATAVGDDGKSVGVLQFYEPTWADLNDLSLSARESAFLSGYYAVVNLSNAIFTDARWLAIAIPVWGLGVLRYLWTHGAGRAESALSGAWGRFSDEPRMTSAAIFWGLVLTPGSFWLLWRLATARGVRVPP